MTGKNGVNGKKNRQHEGRAGIISLASMNIFSGGKNKNVAKKCRKGQDGRVKYRPNCQKTHVSGELSGSPGPCRGGKKNIRKGVEEKRTPY